MLQRILIEIKNEPYRLFFPMGIIYLLVGVLLWLPQLLVADLYPILAHRYLMLNGFSASFIAGFLMTAVPKFSKTEQAQGWEVALFFTITILGLFFSFLHFEEATYVTSALEAGTILLFISRRVLKRQENPPFSFVFIFAGLVLWFFSALLSLAIDLDSFKHLHYEGAIAAIIMGVGGRLIPGILGHTEIVQSQRAAYEVKKPYLLTVPLHFYVLVILFILSYFFALPYAAYLRAGVVAIIAVFYWKIYTFPKERSALTWCIWFSSVLILASFLLNAAWGGSNIHIGHSFFFGGTVLLTLLVATRVLQSHGPKDKRLENLKILYLVTFLIVVAGATRSSAFLIPEYYFSHLAYSSVTLSAAVLIWGQRYLRYIFTHKAG